MRTRNLAQVWPGGGTVYAAVLETVPERVESSNLSQATNMRLWCKSAATQGLSPCAFGRVGSSPTRRTIHLQIILTSRFAILKVDKKTKNEDSKCQTKNLFC